MAYESDISNEEWEIIKGYFDEYKTGRKRRSNIREIINAIRYLERTGCQWRLLPKDFPNYRIVQYYFYKWRDEELWQKIQRELHEKLRLKVGRDPKPSLGIIDSQSVKTVQKGGRVVMMQGKKSREESVILSQTSSGI
jgi:putative transposase